MRIAYLANSTAPNGIYRGSGPMTALAHSGRHRVQPLRDVDRCPPDVEVLHVHRYHEIRAQEMARQARAQGAAVVWDNDDDQGAMPRSVASHRHFAGFAGQRRLAGMRTMFRFTDLVTTPSAVLAERLHELGAPETEVIENFLIDGMLAPGRRTGTGVTIGWIAGLEHQMDVEHVPIVDALQRLLDTRADVSVVTVGLRLGLRGERYHAMGSTPFAGLIEAAGGFDVGIAPLADLPFGRARSNIKLKEYAAAGTPWLASPVGPYRGMGEREGGRLVPDDRWFEELTRLIDKPRDRRRLSKRAARWARGETVTANVERWERALERAQVRARRAAA